MFVDRDKSKIAFNRVPVVFVVFVPVPMLNAGFVPVHVRVTEVTMPMFRTVVRSQFTYAAHGYPCSKTEEREAGQHTHKVAVVYRKNEAAQPHDDRYCKRGHRMPDAGNRGGACRPQRRPSLLPREHGNRSPMIGDERMQNAHSCYSQDEETGGG